METLTISVFVVGATQLLKDYGVISGKFQVQFAAVALGALATYLFQFQPLIWEQLAMIFTGLGLTGSVGLVKEVTKK